MNIERFHNQLAMRLGYERIVKDNRISISVEESDGPLRDIDRARFNKHLAFFGSVGVWNSYF